MLSVVKLLGVKGEPKVMLDLPPRLQVGDPLGLRFRIERRNGGRTEELLVDGQLKVVAVGLDASLEPPRQLLSLEVTGGVPSWRSIKNRPSWPRKVPPARFPKTTI